MRFASRKTRMINPLSRFLDQAVMSAQALVEFGTHLVNPTIRLGVTGMSDAGKTVFITALVHGLMQGGRFPIFEAMAGGRISQARLAPQPDDAVPRFDYETHVRALVFDRRWPESTRRISELRLVIEYQSRRGAMRTLTLDIVDYPGEWLLDLPLLNMSYEQWSAESLTLSRQQPRAALASHWHDHLRTLCDEHATARSLPDAGGFRRIAGIDFRPSRPTRQWWCCALRLAVEHDAPAIRLLQKGDSKTVLSRAFCPIGSANCPGRCTRCFECGAGSVARSRARACFGPCMLQRGAEKRLQHAFQSSDRSYPVRSQQGRPFASVEP
jgi:YcjX-like family, DUF463